LAILGLGYGPIRLVVLVQ